MPELMFWRVSAGESLVKRDSELAEEFAKFREALDETGFEI